MSAHGGKRPGAGRKTAAPKLARLEIKLTPEWRADCDLLAEQAGLSSASEWVRSLIARERAQLKR